jgi:uncharacterized protein (DUF58 family)
VLAARGWTVLVLGVLLLAGGAVAGYPELVAVGLTCLFAVLLAAVWMLARPRVDITRRIEPSRVSVGDSCLAVLTLVNRGHRRCPPIVAVEQVGRRRVVVQIPSLAAGAERTLAYALPTERRGVYAVGPLTIGHADPLRLMQVAEPFQSRSQMWVHPRVLAVSPMPAGHSRDLDGPTSESAPRGGIAFHSLREYIPGDDRRLIHWRSSARTGQLMVRHHVVPDDPHLMVVLDTSREPYTDSTFESAVTVAASIARAAWLNHQPVELRTTSGAIVTAEPRSAEFRDVLDGLAAVERDDADPGLRALLATGRRSEGVSLAVVTGRPRAEQLWVVRQVRPAFQVLSVVCLDDAQRPWENPPGVIGVTAADADDFARRWPAVIGGPRRPGG